MSLGASPCRAPQLPKRRTRGKTLWTEALRAGLVTLGFLGLWPAAPQAGEFWAQSHWINLSKESAQLSTLRQMSRGGYELSDGNYFNFHDLYQPEWRNLRLDFMTEVNNELAITWGLSTGSWGRRFAIDPSFKIGFIYQVNTSRSSTITWSGSAILGGRLREKACVADYGTIGGIVAVNCRLAASFLAPQDTLRYLIDKRPNDYLSSSIKYVLRF
ncbi:hypothetical protein [Phaeovulum sp. W22_SRMD_FR3]|uniref:hypothetical protein n=1 Tax=Phaeovulum sp. W22_SRMD_FR3 TaxID=3240274 RepID=UPI003F9DAEE5